MKTKKKWLLVPAMVVVLSGAAVLTRTRAAGAGSGAADTFQLSYDNEAAGKTYEALTVLDALPAPQHDGYVAELRRGWLLQKLGRNAEAAAAYGRASALEPRSVEARLGLLTSVSAQRRWSDAEKTAREILQGDPGNYGALLRLAFAVYNLGRFDEAAAHYRRLLDMYPSDVEVRAGLGWSLLKAGKSDAAAAEFRAIIDVAPKSALARDGLKALGVPN